MIESLKLINFRQFKKKEFTFKKPITVIVGKNTRGKSSLLEALYYITNGESPWAQNIDIYSLELDHFRIEIDVSEDDDIDTYSIYRDMSKRVFQLNGKATNSKKFFKRLSSTLFSPELIEILLISPSKRRDFLDDLISKIDVEYSREVEKYRKVLRQRNGYIKRLSKRFYETGVVPAYDQQIRYWSDQLAIVSSEIVMKRIHYLARLKDEHFRVEYTSSLSISDMEEFLSLEELKKVHLQRYENSYKRDVALGHTTVGAHRDDWNLFNEKDIKKHGSRGEKRLAIIKLIYLSHALIEKERGVSPILLLDDIPSELDDENIQKIFNEEVLGKQQTFITAIREKEIPKNILKLSNIISLD